jgi:hypothetical protein
MTQLFRTAALAGAALALVACNPDQRESVDSAAGNVGEVARSALTVIDVDMGRRVGADKKISDDADDDAFAKTDTIYASVHTSGLARQGEIVGRWVFPDSSVVEQQADGVTTEGDGYLAFFLTKPDGLTPGTYRFEVLVNGREVRDKEVTVK